MEVGGGHESWTLKRRRESSAHPVPGGVHRAVQALAGVSVRRLHRHVSRRLVQPLPRGLGLEHEWLRGRPGPSRSDRSPRWRHHTDGRSALFEVIPRGICAQRAESHWNAMDGRSISSEFALPVYDKQCKCKAQAGHVIR